MTTCCSTWIHRPWPKCAVGAVDAILAPLRAHQRRFERATDRATLLLRSTASHGALLCPADGLLASCGRVREPLMTLPALAPADLDALICEIQSSPDVAVAHTSPLAELL